MNFKYSDGGRSAYFKGDAGDCVTRSIALAADLDYKTVYDDLKKMMGKGESPRTGVPKKIYHNYILDLGFEWVPFMGVGTGCRVHLKKEELPKGTLICRLSRHVCCVKDYTIYDTYNPSRRGGRCVYGVYIKT